MTPFVNQQFSLQVVERGREVQFVEQFSSDEDVTPAGRHTDDQTACTQHARRRSSSGHPVTSLLYVDGHVAHDAPRAVWVKCNWWSVVDT